MSKLIRSTGGVTDDPTPAQLVEALGRLTERDGSFITLQTDRGVIQSMAGPDGGLLIETVLKADPVVRRTEQSALSIEEVAEAFERFRHGDDSWMDQYAWETEELASKIGRGCAGASAGVFLALVAVVGLALAL